MRLYVLRHGIAEDESPSGRDADRRLTAEGRARMGEAALGLRELGLRFDAILTSPLPRAAETAAIVASAFREGPAPVVVPALATGTGAPELLRALGREAHGAATLIVGHEPTLSALCALLCTGAPGGLAIDLKKGACVAIDVAALSGRARGVLLWALPPKALRRIGRPQR